RYPQSPGLAWCCCMRNSTGWNGGAPLAGAPAACSVVFNRTWIGRRDRCPFPSFRTPIQAVAATQGSFRRGAIGEHAFKYQASRRQPNSPGLPVLVIVRRQWRITRMETRTRRVLNSYRYLRLSFQKVCAPANPQNRPFGGNLMTDAEVPIGGSTTTVRKHW